MLGLAALALSFLPFVQATSASTDGELRQVGSLPRFGPDALAAFGERILPPIPNDPKATIGGTLVAVPEANEVWQLYPLGAFAPTLVAVRDIRSLAITRTFEIPVELRRATHSAPGGDWLHAVDGNRRVFFLTNQGTTGWAVVEVDVATGTTRLHDVAPPFVAPNGFSITGIEADALEIDTYDNAVVLTFGGLNNAPATNTVNFLHRIDLDTGETATRFLRVCNGPASPVELGRTGQFDGMITEKYLYVACHRAGTIGAVVRIERTQMTQGSSREDIVAGPAYLDTSFADPASGRMFLATRAGEVWVFDAATMSFIGVIAAGAEGNAGLPLGYGLDTRSGRFFFQSPVVGVGVAEGRFDPIPQARTFSTGKGDGQERIISDAEGGRILVLVGSNNDREAAYRIYDVGPAPVPPPPPDPDHSTSDIREQVGVTEARFFASGTGYGARTLLAKGIAAVPPQPAIGQDAPIAARMVENLNSRCGFTDRELIAGRVAKAEYDTGATAAEAVGVFIDERTKLDLEHLSRCDVEAKNGNSRFDGLFSIFSTSPEQSPQERELRDRLREQCAAAQQQTNTSTGLSGDSESRECDSGRTWPTQNAFCTSSSGGESDGRLRSEHEEPSKGEVACPSPGGRLTAEAVGYLTGGFKVGRAETDTEITRSSAGVTSTVTSEAHDVDFGGVVHIGEVTAKAVSRSNGRPQDNPMSKYELTIKGLSVTNPATGRRTVLCDEFKSAGGKHNCDIDEALDTLNTLTLGRVEFRMQSGLDAKLLQGSPKGALTAVQKSTARQASDQALVGDRTTEVPAVEVVVYNDNMPFGRARQIFQLAGVSTAATYNIVRLPNGAGFDDAPPFDESSLTPTGGMADGALGGGGTRLGEEGIAASSGTGGSILGRVVRALARGIRMFLTRPRHALLLLTAWAMFSLPPVLARRRRLLAAARSD